MISGILKACLCPRKACTSSGFMQIITLCMTLSGSHTEHSIIFEKALL